MTKSWLAVAVSAVALLAVSSTFDVAQAGRGHAGFSGSHGGARAFSGRAFSGRAFSHRAFSGRAFSGRAFHGGPRFSGHVHGRHAFRGRRFIHAVPLAGYGFYGYGYGYSDSCYWLRRRALATGSGYWWDQYYACVNGYDYY